MSERLHPNGTQGSPSWPRLLRPGWESNETTLCLIWIPHAASANQFTHRPSVYFEEWYDPLISGIGWVAELIEIAAVLSRDPEVILASWCGRQVKPNVIYSRPGWSNIRAVRNNHIYEVPSTTILQPGPASLTDGVQFIHAILARVAGAEPAVHIGAAADPVEDTSLL